MERKSALAARLTYLYLAVPVALFLGGWLRWYFAVIALAALVAGLISAWRHAPKLPAPVWNRKNLVRLVFAFAVIVFFVLVSGIGGYMYQNSDLKWRNSIFEALISYDWPVKDTADGQGVALVYYIGFWLPPLWRAKFSAFPRGTFSCRCGQRWGCFCSIFSCARGFGALPCGLWRCSFCSA